MALWQRSTAVLLCLLGIGAVQARTEATKALSQVNAAIFESAIAEDGLLTLKGVRTAAIAHLAGYRVLPRHGEAAMMAAVCEVAVQSYRAVEAGCGPWLNRPADAALDRGRAAAAKLLRERADDGWDAAVDYSWHPMAPGVYAEFREHSGTPEGFVFGAGWATARGFALASPDELRVPPPPEIDSDRYTRAFDEVKRLGRFQTLARTPDQSHMALWWKEFVESSHNRLARELTAARRPSLAEAARLFALLNASIFDAYVSSFENKFFYNHWRPYTAIRWAANDGNSDTAPDPSWNNTHLHTYAFPSYPSAHGTACGAAMTVFEDVFGKRGSFVMHTPEVELAGPGSERIAMVPPTRRFASFADAARECAESRIHLGIHFRYDSRAGLDLGQRVGALVLERLGGA